MYQLRIWLSKRNPKIISLRFWNLWEIDPSNTTSQAWTAPSLWSKGRPFIGWDLCVACTQLHISNVWPHWWPPMQGGLWRDSCPTRLQSSQPYLVLLFLLWWRIQSVVVSGDESWVLSWALRWYQLCLGASTALLEQTLLIQTKKQLIITVLM